MKIGNVICRLDPLFSFTDASDKGWTVIDRCRGRNDFGVLAIVEKDGQVAGIKESGLEMDIVEVEL